VIDTFLPFTFEMPISAPLEPEERGFDNCQKRCAKNVRRESCVGRGTLRQLVFTPGVRKR